MIHTKIQTHWIAVIVMIAQCACRSTVRRPTIEQTNTTNSVMDSGSSQIQPTMDASVVGVSNLETIAGQYVQLCGVGHTQEMFLFPTGRYRRVVHAFNGDATLEGQLGRSADQVQFHPDAIEHSGFGDHPRTRDDLGGPFTQGFALVRSAFGRPVLVTPDRMAAFTNNPLSSLVLIRVEPGESAIGLCTQLQLANMDAGIANARVDASGTERLPGPIAVCVSVDGGPVRWGLARSQRAGIYDPRAPINPAELNWFVDGGFGCVTYPAPTRPSVRCDPAREPGILVQQILCSQ